MYHYFPTDRKLAKSGTVKFPQLKEFAHFHYTSVGIGNIQVSLIIFSSVLTSCSKYPNDHAPRFDWSLRKKVFGVNAIDKTPITEIPLTFVFGFWGGEGVFFCRGFRWWHFGIGVLSPDLGKRWLHSPLPLLYTIFGGTSIYNCAIQVFIFHTETVVRCPQWTSTMRYKAIFQEYPLFHICIHIVDIYRHIKACRVGIILWRGGRIKRANMGCAA